VMGYLGMIGSVGWLWLRSSAAGNAAGAPA